MKIKFEKTPTPESIAEFLAFLMDQYNFDEMSGPTLYVHFKRDGKTAHAEIDGKNEEIDEIHVLGDRWSIVSTKPYFKPIKKKPPLPDCFAVLGFTETPTLQELKKRFRTFAKEMHPDAGGNVEEFIVLHKFYEEALTYYH